LGGDATWLLAVVVPDSTAVASLAVIVQQVLASDQHQVIEHEAVVGDDDGACLHSEGGRHMEDNEGSVSVVAEAAAVEVHGDWNRNGDVCGDRVVVHGGDGDGGADRDSDGGIEVALHAAIFVVDTDELCHFEHVTV